MSFYSMPGQVQAYVDSSINTVIVQWENLTSAEIVKDCCMAQLEEVKKGAKVIIVDTADAKGVPHQEVQDWFADTLFPLLRDAGLKAIITVLPASAVTKLASKRWTATGKPFSFEMFEAESFGVAKELAQQHST